MDKVKKLVLVSLSIFVFFLATGGEYANDLLSQKAKIKIELAEENNDSSAVPTALSFDIFKSVLHVAHLVFHSDLIFEFKLPVISLTKTHTSFDFIFNFTDYHRTLFRSIISPNAP